MGERAFNAWQWAAVNAYDAFMDTSDRNTVNTTTDPATRTGSIVDGFRLDGKVAVVSGASSGLGARFARVLSGAGARVFALARRVDRLEALASECPGIVPIAVDVTSAADVERLADVLDAHAATVDVLVNNAGLSGSDDPLTESVDHFEHVLDVNLVGLYRLTQVAGRRMVAQGSGSVVNVGSIVGSVSSAPIKQPGYVAAKGAVHSLTRELAVSWARKGVRVNAIAPGFFPSEMTEHMWTDERTLAFVESNCPMARRGRIDELDGALLFLASDLSSYVTGQVLTVDGGWTAR